MEARDRIGQLVAIKGLAQVAIRITSVVTIDCEDSTTVKYIGRLWNYCDSGPFKALGDSKVMEMFSCELGKVLDESEV